MSDYNMGPYRINPKGEFRPDKRYKFLDAVTYNGSQYVNIYKEDTTIGVLPSDTDPEALERWALSAEKGEKGDKPELYDEFLTVEDGAWDYSLSDKIFIPDTSNNILEISNVYNGCCGIIVSALDIVLPTSSDKAIDYDLLAAYTNQYYLYSFICVDYGTGLRYIWNRKVIDKY